MPTFRRRLSPAIAGGTNAAQSESTVRNPGRFQDSPFSGIEWSPAFIAFCLYSISLTTNRVQIGTEGMVLALMTLVLEKGRFRFPSIAVFAVLLATWSVVGLAGSYPEVVADRLVEFWKVCAVVLVAVNVLTTRKRIRAFLIIVMLCYLAYPVRGTLAYYHAGITLEGRAYWQYSYSNPNDLAAYSLLQFSVALGILEVESKLWVRATAWFAVVVLPVIILLTQSRAAFLALGAVMLIAAQRQWRNPKRLILVIVLAGVAALAAPESAWKRFRTIEDVNETENVDLYNESASSTVQRLEIWRVARTIVLENFLTGVGIGAYPNAHFIYAQRPVFNSIARGPRDTHSTYLNIFAETGVVGFTLFMAILVVTLRRSRTAGRRGMKILRELSTQLTHFEIGLYGYLVAGIWASLGELMLTYIHIAIMCAATTLLNQEVAQAERANSLSVGVTAKVPRRGRGVRVAS